MSCLDGVAGALLAKLSPSGALAEVAHDHAPENPELDRLLERFDADEAALAQLERPSLVARLEDDFAYCVPALADAAVPLEAWAIPLLATLAGPCAPLLSFGLQVAVKVALLALKAWAARRLKAKAEPPA